nr:Obg family GTPase CgtA [Angustibacter aerolatus]
MLHVAAGDGGNGCASVHREKFKPLGGPDGGDGGRGGDVVLVVDPSTTTLLEYHHRPHRRAGNGTQGMGNWRDGASGDDLEPARARRHRGDRRGRRACWPTWWGRAPASWSRGAGGAAWATRRWPRPGARPRGSRCSASRATPATSSSSLKSLADVALVGYPSAGKSSLVAAMSAARPKIADYPFTTLVPNLGVVQAGDERFTMADVPGLIPGASEGKGLGLEFLRHVERCSVMVHVLDCATLDPGRDPLTDLDVIEAEPARLHRRRDARRPPAGRAPARRGAEQGRRARGARAWPRWCGPTSRRAAWRCTWCRRPRTWGCASLGYALAGHVAAARAAMPPPAPERVVLRPRAVNDKGFEVRVEQTADGVRFRVLGDRPVRWVRQTDFTNDEAVGYLADRLHRLGVEDQAVQGGCHAGRRGRHRAGEGAVVFDWEPTMVGGAEPARAPRAGPARRRPGRPADPRREAAGPRRPARGAQPHAGRPRGRAGRRAGGRRPAHGAQRAPGPRWLGRRRAARRSPTPAGSSSRWARAR